MLKICFICSCLEPGRDGVGDYVRRLGGELIRRGFNVLVLSLNDKFISQEFNSIQFIDSTELSVLRFPAVKTYTDRKIWFTNQLTQFNPDWVSLQFVNFGFHPYGLPTDLIRLLLPLKSKVNLHLMFHELWCGMSAHATFKEKMLGFFQKGFIKLLYKSLKPNQVFTNVPPYAAYLHTIGIQSTVVPIFGNIPVDEWGSDSDWYTFVDNLPIKRLLNSSKEWLVIGFFGTVYPVPDLQAMIEKIRTAAKQINRKVAVLKIGSNRGEDLEATTQHLEAITYWHIGVSPPAIINRVMQLVDLAIITSPADRLDKSGAAVAWLERGRPILLSSEDKSFNELVDLPAGVYQVNSVLDVLSALHERTICSPVERLKQAGAAYVSLFAN